MDSPRPVKATARFEIIRYLHREFGFSLREARDASYCDGTYLRDESFARLAAHATAANAKPAAASH